MWLTNLSIKRPIAVLMLVAALMVLGWRSMSDMPAELNPNVNFPFVSITTTYPGAGPEEMETLVTKPLEDAVASASGIKNITSQSQEGLSVVSIEFNLGVDADVAAADIRQKVDAAKGELPRDVQAPIISKFDTNAQPILTYGLSSETLDNRELRDLAENAIQYRLAQVPGVGQISVTGGDKREIQVNVDKDRLAAYDLTVQDVVDAVGSQNMNLPGGHVTEGEHDFSIRTVGEYTSVEELRNLKISIPGKGAGNPLQVNLSDVATVRDTSQERSQIARVNGRDSVSIIISKLSDANSVETADGVKKTIAQLEETLPIKFIESWDTSRQVKAALEDVNLSLMLGSLLAVLVVFMFLHNIRGTFIVAIAIPTSIVATFIPMQMFGFTLNQMTMLGLSLVVGILVDDSIVVLENIYRHLQRGETPREAALNGRSEIGLAAITITLVDVVVFVPIGFMGGIVGQFFRQFALTVAFATLFSLFISFTFTPMLASRWYRAGEEVEARRGIFGAMNRFYGWLDERYRRVLRFVIGRNARFPVLRRVIIVVLGYGFLVVTMMFFGPKLGFQFFPVVDSGQVTATVEMPPGASLEQTDRVTRRVEEIMNEVPEKKSLFSTVGIISGGGFTAPVRGRQYASISLNLQDKQNAMDLITGHKNSRTRSAEEIAMELREEVKRIPGAKIVISAISGVGRGGAPVALELTGNDLDRLQEVATQIRDTLVGVPGILNPDITLQNGKPEVQVQLDRTRAADLGVSVRDAAMAMRNAFEGNTDAKYREKGEEYDIRVQYQDLDRQNPEDVGEILVGKQGGGLVELRDVATLATGLGPTKVDRKNRARQVSVIANLAPGFSSGNVQRDIDAALAKIDTSGVTVKSGGDVQSQQEEFPYMMGALMLGAILVYMLMAALFNSLLHPFTIMLSLPMALSGAIIALVITGEAMSIVGMIGIIMLVGLVAKNAILLIDYTNTLRARGYSREDAIEEAGPSRLRPILMTTIAMIFGMLPIAMRIGEASEMRAPLAIVVIGGLILSTLLTLVVIPVLYTLFDDVQRLFSRRKRVPERLGIDTSHRTLHPEEVG